VGRLGQCLRCQGIRQADLPRASADLAASTNISGFAEKYGDFPGYGWYERPGTSEGALLPQEITEFANSGLLIGVTTVNLSAAPEEEFNGFWGAVSTYGCLLLSEIRPDAPSSASWRRTVS